MYGKNWMSNILRSSISKMLKSNTEPTEKLCVQDGKDAVSV